MPELPEVQVTCELLQYELRGQSFEGRVLSDWRKLPPDLGTLDGNQIHKVYRYGKHLFIHTGDHVLQSHLGMSGYWQVRKSPKVGRKHAHFALKSRSGWLTYFDPRRFGDMKIRLFKDLPEIERPELYPGLRLLKLGPDAIGPWFRPGTAERTLTAMLEIRPVNLPIKLALLDQAVVAGIGNIYASEVLFHERINPNREIGDLTSKEIDRLARRIPRLLIAATKSGGTTFEGANRFKAGENEGKFANFLQVYGRKSEPCRRCPKRVKIKSFKQAGRTTFFCPRCQK